ncbi:MAG: hypothetical protein ABW168_03605 [Sedimenticola sp.]
MKKKSTPLWIIEKQKSRGLAALFGWLSAALLLITIMLIPSNSEFVSTEVKNLSPLYCLLASCIAAIVRLTLLRCSEEIDD